eukprot:gene42541-34250_t
MTPLFDIGVYGDWPATVRRLYGDCPAFTDRLQCGLRGTDGDGFLLGPDGAQPCVPLHPPGAAAASTRWRAPATVELRDRVHGCAIRFEVDGGGLRYTVDGAARPAVTSLRYSADGPRVLFNDGARGVNLPRRGLAAALHG